MAVLEFIISSTLAGSKDIKSEIPPNAMSAYIISINADPVAIAMPSLISPLNPLEIRAKAIGPSGGTDTMKPVIIPAIKVIIINYSEISLNLFISIFIKTIKKPPYDWGINDTN
jgi:hypothetical protein